MPNKAYQYPNCTFVECDKDKDNFWIKYDPELIKLPSGTISDKDYLWIKYNPETLGKKIRFKKVKYAKGRQYIPSRIIDIDDNQEYDVKQDNDGAYYYITDNTINYILIG